MDATKRKNKFIPSRLRCAETKLQKYTKKLAQSSYYLAARVFNPQCRTAFLKDDNGKFMSVKAEQKFFIVRKLWERHRGEVKEKATSNPSTSYDTSNEPLSIFHQALQQRLPDHIQRCLPKRRIAQT